MVRPVPAPPMTRKGAGRVGCEDLMNDINGVHPAWGPKPVEPAGPALPSAPPGEALPAAGMESVASFSPHNKMRDGGVDVFLGELPIRPRQCLRVEPARVAAMEFVHTGKHFESRVFEQPHVVALH